MTRCVEQDASVREARLVCHRRGIDEHLKQNSRLTFFVILLYSSVLVLDSLIPEIRKRVSCCMHVLILSIG